MTVQGALAFPASNLICTNIYTSIREFVISLKRYKYGIFGWQLQQGQGQKNKKQALGRGWVIGGGQPMSSLHPDKIGGFLGGIMATNLSSEEPLGVEMDRKPESMISPRSISCAQPSKRLWDRPCWCALMGLSLCHRHQNLPKFKLLIPRRKMDERALHET